MAEPDCRKQLGGEPLKYISVQGPHWLRNDGIVERRSSDGRTLLQHRHVPRESPWVALSTGAAGGAHLAQVAEMAWLRADGAVDLTVTAGYFNFNADARNREAALIHDFKIPVAKYTGRAHVVQPPIGCRYTAVAAGVRHACGAGVAATYCLRSDGLVDRITTTTGGMEGGMMPLKRSAPVRATLSTPDGVTYTAVIAGYYASYLVRSDGALDVLSETRAQGNKEVSEGGRLECTIPAPAGTAYVGMVAHGIGGKFGTERAIAWKFPFQPRQHILRADGAVDVMTPDGRAVASTIEAPAAARYVGGFLLVEYGTTITELLLLRSDGRVDVRLTHGVTTVSPPTGVAYVKVCGGTFVAYGGTKYMSCLVRSDGAVDELQVGTSKTKVECAVLRSISPSDDETVVAGGCCVVL